MAKLVRRRGLTDEEKQCMRRPIPSEQFLLKAQMRQKKDSCEKMIEICQSDSEVTLKQCFESVEQPEHPEQPEDPDECVPSFLQSEQHLADVIQRILPVDKFECSNSSFRPMSKTVSLRLSSKPTRRNALKYRGAVEPGLPPEAPRLALLRKDRAWDPKTFPLRKNSIDLVKGACAQSIERVLGGKFVADAVPCQMASITRRKNGKRRPWQEWVPSWSFSNLLSFLATLSSLLVIFTSRQCIQRLEVQLDLLSGSVKDVLLELEQVQRDLANLTHLAHLATLQQRDRQDVKIVEEEADEPDDSQEDVEPSDDPNFIHLDSPTSTALIPAPSPRRPSLLGRGVSSSCFDVATTGLSVECHSMSAAHCERGQSAAAIKAMCPRSCNASCDGPCKDLDFTTFQEQDGTMSSCSQLQTNCKDRESGERVRRICPVTCGVCPGAPLSIPSASEQAFFTLLRNRTLAIERELTPPMQSKSADYSMSGKSWTIPQILHQTWKTDQIPKKYREEMSSWRRLHPHWHFEFWDDARSADLMWDVFPQHAPAFEEMSGIKRADISRIVALYAYGGVYADIDVEATKCFDPLLRAAHNARMAVLLGEENIVHTVLLEKRLSGRLVSNAVMASAPQHPFWLEVLREIFQRSCGSDPVLCTGPRLIDRMSLLHSSCRRGCVARLPFDYFSPNLARWNAASMTSSCRDLFADPGQLLPNHRQALRFACASLEALLRDEAALHSGSTFAVHRWQCSWCREDVSMRATMPLREIIFEVGNASLRRMDKLSPGGCGL
eukprot:symbB.v1.2.035460.t1/scaffold4779.1/size34930/1